MPYDAEIRIKTKVDNSEFVKGAEKIESKLEEIKESAEEIRAVDFDWTKNSKNMAVVSEKIKEIEKSLDKTSTATKKSEEHLNALKIDVEEYSKTLKELGSQGKYFGDADYDRVYLAWQNAKTAVKEYEAELYKQTASGQVQEAEKIARTKEKELLVQKKIEEQAERNLQKENSKLERAIKIDAAIREQATTEYRIAQIKNTSIASDQKIVNLLERRKQLTGTLKLLEKAGVGVGYKEWESKKAEILEIDAAVKKYSQTLFGARKGQKGVSDGLRKLGEAGKKVFMGMINGARKSNKSMGGFAGRLKSIALSLLVFNWITKGFNTMVTGVKEGFKTLAKHSESYSQSLSDLMGANIQMKNSFAAAFAPIVQLIIPHLITLINYVTLASNKIAQFIAVMSGQTTWTKATEVQGDYAGSLNGTAAAAKKAMGALAKFDDLDVLNKSDSGGGSSKPEGGFEEVPLPDNEITNLAKRLKELIGAEDWHGVGALLGEKLNDALGGIDWTSIKQKARELGKNIALFLNGGIETINWHLVGSTLAEGVNTAIEFMYGFVTTFGWAGLGSAIASSINGFFDTFDPAKAGITLSDFIVGVLTAAITAVDDTEWDEVGKDIATFLNTIEWDIILKTTGELIVSSIIAALDFVKGFDKEADNITKSIVNGFLAAGIAGKVAQAFKLTLGETIAVALFGYVAKQSLDGVTEPIKNAEALLDAMPKKEDYDNIQLYNQALTEWKEEMENLSATQFELPFLKYDENGTPEWWTNLKQSCVDAVASFNEWAGNFKDELPGKINVAMDGMRGAFETKWAGICTWWSGTALVGWWNNHVAPWFTAEKWQELGQGILDGISTKWGEFCLWWSESALVAWWEEHVVPWFSAETWLELGQGILDGIGEKWGEFSSWWDTTINDWFTNNVAVWFTVEKWKAFGDAMKKGIYNGFCGIVSGVVNVVNGLILICEKMVNFIIDNINDMIDSAKKMADVLNLELPISTIPSMQFKRVSMPSIPALANGAVLRGGNPFMAILGDQPRGQTNVETPVYVIEDAVSKAMGRYSGSGSMTVNLNYDGETFARLCLKDILSEMDRQGYDVDVLGGLT